MGTASETNKDCKICGRPGTTRTVNCYITTREGKFIHYTVCCIHCKLKNYK